MNTEALWISSAGCFLIAMFNFGFGKPEFAHDALTAGVVLFFMASSTNEEAKGNK